MYKVILCALTILLLCIATYAQQQVIASGGDYTSNSHGSLRWTLGEIIIETSTSSGTILTQGFQQTVVEAKPSIEMNHSEFQINVFPNPFTDKITIVVDHYEGTHYCLLDVQGRVILSDKIEAAITSIDVKNLPVSLYVIKILRGITEINSYKLTKY